MIETGLTAGGWIAGVQIALAVLVIFLMIVRIMDKRHASLSTVAIALVTPLNMRIAALEGAQENLLRRVKDLETENLKLWEWGRLNFAKVTELGGVPHPLQFP